jgi:hypothetical protein
MYEIGLFLLFIGGSVRAKHRIVRFFDTLDAW